MKRNVGGEVGQRETEHRMERQRTGAEGNSAVWERTKKTKGMRETVAMKDRKTERKERGV